jgi:capsular polysaccharide biosynthesis protein
MTIRATVLRPAPAPGIRTRRYSQRAVIAHAPRRHRTVSPTGLASLMFVGEAVRRRAWVWCATGMAGLVIGAGLYVLAPEAYQAQTSVLVTNDVNTDPGVQIEGDIEIAQNAQVAERAMDALGSQQSVSSFLASYSVSAASDQVLQINTRARSADAAVREADAVAAAFLKFRADALTTQQRLAVAALGPLVAVDKRQFNALIAKITRVTAEPRTRARHAELRRLEKKYRKAGISLGALEYTLTNYPAVTQSMVQGTRVLDPAVPVPPSRRHVAVLVAIAGLICGLGIGFGVVIVSALMSDRPRRRDDVARLLGSVVRSVGRPRQVVRSRRVETGHLADRLGDVISDRGRTALAVVAVDSVRPAALALAALAVSYAKAGRRVVLADLSGNASAARVFGVREPGVNRVEASGGELVVIVPESDEVGPLGSSGIGIGSQVGRPSGSGAAATITGDSADLLLSLAELDPAVGADQLATWAKDVAVVMTAGRSAPKAIHAVGEMVRVAGLRLALGVLLRADNADESLGFARPRAGWRQASRV